MYMYLFHIHLAQCSSYVCWCKYCIYIWVVAVGDKKTWPWRQLAQVYEATPRRRPRHLLLNAPLEQFFYLIVFFFILLGGFIQSKFFFWFFVGEQTRVFKFRNETFHTWQSFWFSFFFIFFNVKGFLFLNRRNFFGQFCGWVFFLTIMNIIFFIVVLFLSLLELDVSLLASYFFFVVELI